jgi:hypothetical protein
MYFTEDDVRSAGRSIALTAAQIEGLVSGLRARASTRHSLSRTRFDLVHLLWYGGALIVMGAMALFTTLAFEALGGGALAIIALIYAGIFAVCGDYLWHVKQLRTPGGLMITIAVAMVPLAVYGIQDAYGMWGDGQRFHDFHIWIRSSFLPMELATIAASLIALRFYRFPFIVAILAFALWYLTMDLAAWILVKDDSATSYDWMIRRRITMLFGLIVLAVAWMIDLSRRNDEDFAFWLYLAGLLAFWGGLTLSDESTELGKAAYCLINVMLVLVSVFLMRRAFAVFGAFGISIYLGHLANQVFADSLAFPFALSAIGVAIIGAGLMVHRYRPAISACMSEKLPASLKKLRPPHADGLRTEFA